MPNLQNIKSLAAELHCSESDLLALANGVVNGLRADKAEAHFVANENERSDMALAYAADYVKKVCSIVSTCLTRTDCRDAMRQQVYALLNQ